MNVNELPPPVTMPPGAEVLAAPVHAVGVIRATHITYHSLPAGIVSFHSWGAWVGNHPGLPGRFPSRVLVSVRAHGQRRFSTAAPT